MCSISRKSAERKQLNDLEAILMLQRWFVAPIAHLKKLPSGDGGFVALLTAITLYERLVNSRLKIQGLPQDLTSVKLEVERELQLTPEQRSIFWTVFRIGLAHQAMPMAGKTAWALGERFNALPSFQNIGGIDYVCIDPWKFAERVLQAFLDKPQLINATESFQFGTIGQLPPE
jgi:hypothetical protein